MQASYGEGGHQRAFLLFKAVAQQREHMREFTLNVMQRTGTWMSTDQLRDRCLEWLREELRTWTGGGPLSESLYSLLDIFSSGGDANNFAIELLRNGGLWLLGNNCYGCSKGPLAGASIIGVASDSVHFFGHTGGWPVSELRYVKSARGGLNPEGDLEEDSGGSVETPAGNKPASIPLPNVLPMAWCPMHPMYLDADNQIASLFGHGLGNLSSEGLPSIVIIQALEKECLDITAHIIDQASLKGTPVGVSPAPTADAASSPGNPAATNFPFPCRRLDAS